MPNNSWVQTLIEQDLVGTAFSSFTTAKSVINSAALLTLPAGFFSRPGIQLKVKVLGSLSNIVTTPGTITFQVMFGAVIAWSSGAVQLNATAHTLLPFTLDVDLTCRAAGSGTSANVIGIGKLGGIHFTNTAAQVDAVNTTGQFILPVTAPAVSSGFDSTSAQQVDFFTGFSISNAANTVRIETYEVISTN